MKKYGHFSHRLNETVAVNFDFPARGRKRLFSDRMWRQISVDHPTTKKSQASSSVLPPPLDFNILIFICSKLTIRYETRTTGAIDHLQWFVCFTQLPGWSCCRTITLSYSHLYRTVLHKKSKWQSVQLKEPVRSTSARLRLFTGRIIPVLLVGVCQSSPARYNVVPHYTTLVDLHNGYWFRYTTKSIYTFFKKSFILCHMEIQTVLYLKLRVMGTTIAHICILPLYLLSVKNLYAFVAL